jgi:hypothetical protein
MPKAADSAERLWQADGLVTLLAKVDPEKLPPQERNAVGECQAQAVDEWLAAYIELRKTDDPNTEPTIR